MERIASIDRRSDPDRVKSDSGKKESICIGIGKGSGIGKRIEIGDPDPDPYKKDRCPLLHIYMSYTIL